MANADKCDSRFLSQQNAIKTQQYSSLYLAAAHKSNLELDHYESFRHPPLESSWYYSSHTLSHGLKISLHSTHLLDVESHDILEHAE